VARARAAADGGLYVVGFSGLGSFFEPFLDEREHVRARLHAMLAPRIRAMLDEAPTDFEVGLHARRGDKPALRMGELPTQPNVGMPDEWFVNVVNNIRRIAGREVRVKVFSDARPEQLSAILSLPGVSLAPERPSIVDILLLARSRVLVPTGGSTFGMWSSFLGEMPTLWYPTMLTRLHPDRAGFDAELDLAGEIPESAARVIERALNSPSR
jgi:hypothetical protein